MANALASRRSQPTPPDPRRSGSRGVARASRWLIVLIAVAVLHWIAAQWFERHRVAFDSADHEHVPVQIALLTPERIERQAATNAAPSAAAAPAPAPAAHARPPATNALREHRLTAVTSAKPAAPAATNASPASVAASVDAAASTPIAAAAPANAASAAASTAPSTAPSKGVKFSVPPSGDLQYDTFYNGVRNPVGTIHWASDSQSYEMVVSVPVPFVGPFVYSSHGRIDAFGLAPDQYVEKRGRRAADIAVFNRTDRRIAFTKTPASLPLPDGAQDRFSMVMQLASLVRGDPAAYQPGVTRQFFVVDNDSGENWPVETVGDETIRTAEGYLQARHFKRLPRHEGDQRRIDVWLAPSLGWLPARIVQTEPNGTQFELMWHGKLALDNPAPAPSQSPIGHANDPAAPRSNAAANPATAAPGNSVSSALPVATSSPPTDPQPAPPIPSQPATPPGSTPDAAVESTGTGNIKP